MSSGSSIFELLFQSALEEYKKETNIDLVKHPLADQLERCDSVEAITQAVQEQAQAFRDFRGGDDKLITTLKNVVQVLYRISSSPVNLGDAIGLQAPLVKMIHTSMGVLLSGVNDVSASYDALIDLFESICSFLQRLDIYTKVQPTRAMAEVIVKILVQLLHTFAVATKQIKQGRLKKFGKKLFGDNDIETVLHRLDRLTPDEARAAAVQTLQVVYGLSENLRQVMNDGNASAESIQKALEMIQQLTSEVNKSKRDQLQRDIQKWLSPPDPWINYNIAREIHHDGTATWFIRRSDFAEWKSSPSSLLWVHGKPGSGKSILSSSIIENIDYMRRAGLASLGFYFFDFRDTEKKHRRGLLTSLLWQLSDQSDSYSDVLLHLYSTHRHGSQSPSDGALAQCLKDILCSEGQAPVYLILDALDECPNAFDTPTPREKVLMFVKDLVGLRLSNLRICLTSRPEVDIEAVLDPLKFCPISLHDQDGQQQDILDYIRTIVHSDRQTRRWRAADKELVIDVLSQKANGMFRWVFCQFDFLRGCLPARIRRAISELPETLDATYERSLRDMKKANWEFAHRLLQCVAAASRPLRVEELAEYLAFDFEAGPIPEFDEDLRLEDPVDAVLSTCSSLVAVVNVGDSRTIQFSHFSVKEYLTSSRLAESSDNLSRQYHVSMPFAHTLVAQACLGILLHLDNSITSDSLQKFPLAEYAAEHWIGHALFGGVSGNVEDGMKQLFDPRKSHFGIWVWIFDPASWRQDQRAKTPSRPRGTPLHYAAMCGLESIVKFLIVQHSQDVHSRAFEAESTPLHAAASRGHVGVTHLLFECGADVAAQDNTMSTPLHEASTQGCADLVRILVKRGGDVKARDKHGLAPLHWASFRGQVDVAHVLLECGADVIAQADNGDTPLHEAANMGHVELTHVLLKSGANANARGNTGLTALHRASHRGYIEIARLLLKYGADANPKSNRSWTPLHEASYRGWVEIARLLLESGADVNTRNDIGLTPLHRASLMGYVELARVFLERGANATARTNEGWTPLHFASSGRSVDMIRVLLECGVDVMAQDNKGSTPLDLASEEGGVELAKILREAAEVQQQRH